MRSIAAGPTSSPIEGNLGRNYRVVSIDAMIAADAVELSLPQSDPFDRIIVATARRHRVPLITRDREITASGYTQVVW